MDIRYKLMFEVFFKDEQHLLTHTAIYSNKVWDTFTDFIDSSVDFKLQQLANKYKWPKNWHTMVSVGPVEYEQLTIIQRSSDNSPMPSSPCK